MKIVQGAHKVRDERTYKIIGVEIKALSQLYGTEEAQILNYLKATKLSPGLLINFGAKSLEHKTFVYSF